jgi:NADPH:quinone reductase-like Zn-dependent oxidoreductase
MKAFRFARFGSPEVLQSQDFPDPIPGSGEARVRIVAASVNPSDVKNVQGAMSQTTLPRTPGRDYAGVVDLGPREWRGAEVWGTGNSGFTRDGTHAQYIVVPIESLRRRPATLSFDQAACVGVNFLTAWRGLIDTAMVLPGEIVAIIGAGGGVGGAVAQIARRRGARIIGIDRRQPHPGAPVLEIADHLIVGAGDVAAALRQATQGRGADIVFDTVGGVMFETALACLGWRGRLVEISATGQRQVSFDLADFYHNESRLLGIDTLKVDLVGAAEVLGSLRPGFEAGDYRPAPIARSFPLNEAVAAYQAVARGEHGRMVLRPGD